MSIALPHQAPPHPFSPGANEVHVLPLIAPLLTYGHRHLATPHIQSECTTWEDATSEAAANLLGIKAPSIHAFHPQQEIPRVVEWQKVVAVGGALSAFLDEALRGNKVHL